MKASKKERRREITRRIPSTWSHNWNRYSIIQFILLNGFATFCLDVNYERDLSVEHLKSYWWKLSLSVFYAVW